MTQRFRVTITRAVYDELAEIHAYAASDSPDQAADLLRAILSKIETLDTMPSASPRYGRRRSTGLPVQVTHEHSFKIYYTVDRLQPEVVVLTVIRAARRQPRRFE